ncbi:hypothetical protein PFISCL1PPCAC_5825, partial [Pristionchus fissidentatus]
RNYFHQDVPVRIFNIDSLSSNRNSNFYKLMGNWTISTGVLTYYESLTQNPREIFIYRVATVIQPPFMQKYPDWNTGSLLEGYCKDLIDLIKENVNNFTYVLFEVEDGTFGTMDFNGNWNGIMGALVSGSADIALAPLSVTAERENDVDFTVPYYDLVGTTILMKKNDVDNSLFIFMKVLEWKVWVCIVAAYIVASLLLWVFDRFSPTPTEKTRWGPSTDLEIPEFSLKKCIWFCMNSLVVSGGGKAPKNISGRIVAATWWIFGLLMVASYASKLAGSITATRLEESVSSLDDLAKQFNIEYAPMKGSAAETYFRRMAENEEQFHNIWKEMSLNESMTRRERSKFAVGVYPVSNKYSNMWRFMQKSGPPESFDDAINRVLTSTDGFAFIGDGMKIKYAELTNCNLQSVGNEFSRKRYGVAVQTGHPLKDEISRAILIVRKRNNLDQLKKKWWIDNPRKKVCAEIPNDSDGISIQKIGGVFIIMITGIVSSTVTLIFEFFYFRSHNQVSKDHASREDVPRENEDQSPPLSLDEQETPLKRVTSLVQRR